MKGGRKMDSLLMTADEVARDLKVSKNYAYKIIRKMNEEMREKGYYTVPGKVNRKYFLMRVDFDTGKEGN